MSARACRSLLVFAVMWVSFILFVQTGYCEGEATKRKLDAFMHTLGERGQFSGAVLVADANGILYESALGLSDHQRAKPFATETQSCLASLSKPFTALLVMMQVQNGSMGLDDPVSKYVTGLNPRVGAVTIRQLLTHTSGLPDYGNTPVDHPGATTADVLHNLRMLDHLEFAPGERYRYSNSGYVLLGAVVEKVAGVPFSELLQTRILAPVGMKHTFLLTHEGQKTSQAAIGYDDFGDLDDYAGFVAGDGGMYSTVEDLYRFDRALRGEALVSQAILNKMFTPATVRAGTTSYGLGWNVENTAQGKRVWHTGSTAGFRAYFERWPTKQRLIVLLTNQGNSKRVEISAAINNLLDGQPFAYPKQSGAVALEKVYRGSGITRTLSAYRSLKQGSSEEYDLSEAELNTLGYQIFNSDHSASNAAKVFALNASEHPSSSNAFDSLAEAEQAVGDSKAAKANYQRALELDPSNEHARTAITQMK